MRSTKKWDLRFLGNGRYEVVITKWRHFMEFVCQEMIDYEAYIWRGQRREDWELESCLDRLIKKANHSDVSSWDFRQRHLEKFKYAARGRRGPNPTPIKDENEWWSLGQHHGLATPLLDWTTSPFVAAYFAFIENVEDRTPNRAIFSLFRPTIERVAKEKSSRQEAANRKELKALREEREQSATGAHRGFGLREAMLELPVRPEVEFISPLTDENQRLVNQGGLFSRIPNGTSLEKWVEKNMEEEDRNLILVKILVPDGEREKCLKTLNRMNINHLSLFPDLFGASMFCNLFGEIEGY